MRGKVAKRLRKQVGYKKIDDYFTTMYEVPIRLKDGSFVVDDKGKKLKAFKFTNKNVGERAEYLKIKKEYKKCY